MIIYSYDCLADNESCLIAIWEPATLEDLSTNEEMCH